MAVSEIQFVLPEFSNRITIALEGIDGGPPRQAEVQVAPHELKEGMVLVEDVISESGALTVSSGRRLTRPIIEKLQQYAAGAAEPLSYPVAGVRRPPRETAAV